MELLSSYIVKDYMFLLRSAIDKISYNRLITPMNDFYKNKMIYSDDKYIEQIKQILSLFSFIDIKNPSNAVANISNK